MDRTSPARPVDPRFAPRTAILAAAEELFADDGLYDVSVEQITRRAGVAKGTFYLYFQSKEELVRTVAHAAFDDLGGRCRAAVVDAADRDQRIRALIGAHLAYFAERPDRMRILHQVRGMMKFARPEWHGLRRALAGHLGLVRELAADGDDAIGAEVSYLLFGVISGVASVWIVAGPTGSRSGRRVSLPARLVDLVTESSLAAVRSVAEPRRPRPHRAADRARPGRR